MQSQKQSARRLLATVLCLLVAFGCKQGQQPRPLRASVQDTHFRPSASDVAFLDDLERRSFQYFLDRSDPNTGLVADRAPADGTAGGTHDRIASIAATGFGLTAICLADDRGWIEHPDAYRRAVTTLRFLRDRSPNVHGFFYHFVDMPSGRRMWNCELSSIDTALLIAGVLAVREHFRGTEAETLACDIYQRVDWPWMLAGGSTLSMGWTPERGFLAAHWDRFSESPILYLLALGSSTHALAPECWRAWRRQPVATYAGRTFMQSPPLFVHQYPHAWIDFRHKKDDFTDYWQNSVDATLAHRQFCIDLSAQRHFPYTAQLWGITASDSEHGYVAWGGPPANASQDSAARLIDGTVVPCAVAGSLPFVPDICLEALRSMHDQYGNRIYSRYGFVDAFNPATAWTDTDVIGIDVGITLLMAENFRTGWIWNCFMKNPEIQRAMRLAGFHEAPFLSSAEQK